MNKYCPKCGTAVTAKAKFCPKCGFAFQDGDNGVKQDAAGDVTAQSVSAAPADSAAAKNSQAAAPKKNQARIEYDDKHASSKKHWTRWVVAAVVAVVLIVFGYRQFYVPHTVESALDANNFTAAKGYTASANLSKHEVVIYPNSTAEQKIAQELTQNEYDTRRIAVENNLADLARDLAGKTFGTWKVGIVLRDSQGSTLMWEYNGTKETHRFQTSNAGRQLREEYLNEKLSSNIGFLLGGL